MDFRYPPLLLASRSPRRRELLEQLGVPHEVIDVGIDETPLPGEGPEAYVVRLAAGKASAARHARTDDPRPVLGADTTVVVDGRLLGQPVDCHDAVGMLMALAGRTHEVHTGIALACIDGRLLTACSCTRVRFRPFGRATAEAYWATGEPMGKAGAYAIQGRGAALVEALEGSYSGVVGLPLFELAELVRGLEPAPATGPGSSRA